MFTDAKQYSPTQQTDIPWYPCLITMIQ
jgi:hypothetical protein